MADINDDLPVLNETRGSRKGFFFFMIIQEKTSLTEAQLTFLSHTHSLSLSFTPQSSGLMGSSGTAQGIHTRQDFT